MIQAPGKPGNLTSCEKANEIIDQRGSTESKTPQKDDVRSYHMSAENQW